MANLSWLRENFTEISGRLDLTTEQQDFYINAGIKFLDEQTEFCFTNNFVLDHIDVNSDRFVLVAPAKTINQVILNPGDDSTELRFYDQRYFTGETSETLDKYTVQKEANGTELIIINKAVDEQTVLLLRGHFYSPVLVAETDTNFWTVNYALAVLHSACYQLELFQHNPEGQKEWLATLQPVISAVSNNRIEQESNYIRQMEG